MSDKDGSSSDESEVFVVEKILDKRIKNGVTEYFIKWHGYNNPDDNTWEPKENCACNELIDEFEKNYARSDQVKKKRSKEPTSQVKAKQPQKDRKSRTRTPEAISVSYIIIAFILFYLDPKKEKP
jgi:hypothetical protein